MLKSIHIKNYKSVNDLPIELGRVNLFIGENGSGKSNILEAVAFAAAAEADKLDHEFLASRGIRVTPPVVMRSAFEQSAAEQPIEITIDYQGLEKKYVYSLINKNTPYSDWQYISSPMEMILNMVEEPKEVAEILDRLKVLSKYHKIGFRFFVIYSPENTALRNFYAEGQIEPLGIHGIDLGDEEQRLFVVSRNKQGHTRVKRITLADKPRSSSGEDLKLSEALLRGYLGGLPKGF